MKKCNLKKLSLTAILVATAIILSIAEAQIPSLVSVPGIKPGLANIVTLISMYLLGNEYAGGITLLRVSITGVFSGQFVYFLFSLSGSALSFAAMCLFKKILGKNQIWAVSIFGAIFHIAGQILAAVFIMNTLSVLWYFPVLICFSIISGAFTGICSQSAINRLKNIKL